MVRFRSLTDFLVPVLQLSGVIQAPALHFLGLFEHWGLLLIPGAAPTLIMMGASGPSTPCSPPWAIWVQHSGWWCCSAGRAAPSVTRGEGRMTARSILAFGLNDSRLILRDSSRMMAVMIVLIALGLLRPAAADRLSDGLGLLPGAWGRPASHYPLALAYFSLFDGPLLVGFIFGFVVLDGGGRTLDAMAVTGGAGRLYAGGHC